MNSSVFEEVLREMDSRFRLQNKKILLLVDNASSHFDPHYSPLLENDNDDDESFNGKFYLFFLSMPTAIEITSNTVNF
jgi:hypothetical protein